MAGRIGFMEIATVIREALKEHQSVMEPLLQDTIVAAQWAMQRVRSIVEG